MTIDNNFICTHAHIVRCIAKQFSNNTNDRQNLMQEGYIGLIEAAKRYDPDAGPLTRIPMRSGCTNSSSTAYTKQ